MAKKSISDIQDLVLSIKDYKDLNELKDATRQYLSKRYGKDRLEKAISKAEYNFSRGRDKDLVTFLSLLSVNLEHNADEDFGD